MIYIRMKSGLRDLAKMLKASSEVVQVFTYSTMSNLAGISALGQSKKNLTPVGDCKGPKYLQSTPDGIKGCRALGNWDSLGPKWLEVLLANDTTSLVVGVSEAHAKAFLDGNAPAPTSITARLISAGYSAVEAA